VSRGINGKKTGAGDWIMVYTSQSTPGLGRNGRQVKEGNDRKWSLAATSGLTYRSIENSENEKRAGWPEDAA